MTEAIDYAKLGEEIAKHLAKSIISLDPDALWDVPDIARYTGKSVRWVQNTLRRGDFPRGIRLAGGHPRWRAGDVIEWAANQPKG